MSEEKTERNVLALDLGSMTGWALSRGGQVSHGTWDFKPKRFEGGGMRYLRFEKALDEFLSLVGHITELHFEEVRGHKGTSAAHVYGGLLAVLTSWCEKKVPVIPYQGVHTAEIKRHATGKGNANKGQMWDAALAKGWEPKDENDCDALWLLDMVMSGGA